jgi:lipopolysaccharide transport protein LptA
MAPTRPSPRWAVALALLALACGARGAPRIDTSHGEIKTTANHMDIDFKTHQVVLRGNAKISQGDFSVTADRAEGSALEFQNSHWVFIGNVRIHSEQHGTIESDRATVDFRDNQIEKAVVSGSPAQFEQTGADDGVLARGHAASIEYEVGAGTVRMSDDQNAWLSYGTSQITSPLIVYDIRAQQVQAAGTEGDKRVHVTIVPKQDNARREKKP